MIQEILRFVKTEKAYTVLFVILVLFFGYRGLFSGARVPSKETETVSRAVEDFRQKQDLVELRIKDKTFLKSYLQAHPESAVWFGVAFYLPMAGFALGWILILFLAASDRVRAKWFRSGVPPSVTWPFSMIVKVLLLFIVSSVALATLIRLVEVLCFHREGVSNLATLVHTTINDLLCFLWILYVIGKQNGTSRDLGLRLSAKGFWREVWAAWGGYLLLIPIFFISVFVLLYAADFFHYEPPPHPLVNVFLEEAKSPWLMGYSLFLGVFFGPFFEEIFFRGFCYPILKNKWGVHWAAVLTAAFFAVIHDSAFTFLPIFILGLGLAYLYEKRGSLAAPIVLHMTHNALFIAYFFIVKKAIQKLAGA